VEGAALAIAVIEHVRAAGALCLATTHYTELKTYALDTEGVQNASCEFDVASLRPTYRLLIGTPGKSNAFAISERLGLDSSLIARAQSYLDSDHKHFEEILELSDGIMIARGDMGVEVDYATLPGIQKRFIELCNRSGKPVITATQMLDSMIRNPRPTRAEVTDVANAIYDGTDAIMLSGETAVGKYPVEAVTLMSQIAVDSEAYMDERHFMRHRSAMESNTISSSVCFATVATAKTLKAKAIIIPTFSGTTARLMSNFRPDIPIYAVSPSEEMVRRMQVYWGVTPLKGRKERNQYLLVDHAVEACKKNGFVEEDDLIVVTAGDPVSNLSEDSVSVTNMMSVIVVE
jgi:pyruvate kinase